MTSRKFAGHVQGRNLYVKTLRLSDTVDAPRSSKSRSNRKNCHLKCVEKLPAGRQVNIEVAGDYHLDLSPEVCWSTV